MNIAGDSTRTVQRLTLTERQRMILEFVIENIRTRGFPPTLREIGESFHIRSTNGVNDHLRALERKGYIRRDDMKSRGIRVLGLSVPDQSSSPETGLSPSVPLGITVERLPIVTALAELESIGDWIPRPVAERFEEAIAEIRAQLLRGIPCALASSPEAA